MGSITRFKVEIKIQGSWFKPIYRKTREAAIRAAEKKVLAYRTKSDQRKAILIVSATDGKEYYNFALNRRVGRYSEVESREIAYSEENVVANDAGCS